MLLDDPLKPYQCRKLQGRWSCNTPQSRGELVGVHSSEQLYLHLTDHLVSPNQQNIAAHVFWRYKYNRRPTARDDRRLVFQRRAAFHEMASRPPPVAMRRRAQENHRQEHWPLPIPNPRPLWSNPPIHYQPLFCAPVPTCLPVCLPLPPPVWFPIPWYQ